VLPSSGSSKASNIPVPKARGKQNNQPARNFRLYGKQERKWRPVGQNETVRITEFLNFVSETGSVSVLS
jgi:hypothetical protein